MPLYEFKCQKCQQVFEKIQSSKDKNPNCPNCQGETDKLISRSSFALKGGGWYSDGYGK